MKKMLMIIILICFAPCIAISDTEKELQLSVPGMFGWHINNFIPEYQKNEWDIIYPENKQNKNTTYNFKKEHGFKNDNVFIFCIDKSVDTVIFFETYKDNKIGMSSFNAQVDKMTKKYGKPYNYSEGYYWKQSGSNVVAKISFDGDSNLVTHTLTLDLSNFGISF